MSTQNINMPFLKADAVVPVEIGSGFVRRLQKVLVYLRAGKSREDLAELKRRIESKEPLEDWMEHLATLTGLLQGIEASAQQRHLVEYRDISLPDSPPAHRPQ
jgi:hypothetical protein